MDLQKIADALATADLRLGAGRGAPKADMDLIRDAAKMVEEEIAKGLPCAGTRQCPKPLDTPCPGCEGRTTWARAAVIDRAHAVDNALQDGKDPVCPSDPRDCPELCKDCIPHPEAREEDVEKALAAIEKAYDKLTALCHGERWTLSIPADRNNDPDLVIGDALLLSRAALSRRAAPKGSIAPWYGLISTYPNLAGDDPLRRAYENGVHDAEARLAAPKPEGQDALAAFMVSQIEWSSRTFGPAMRTGGILKHIAKELAEIEASPRDLSEWIDVVILALDGYWRHGGRPETIMRDLNAKAAINHGRTYPVPTSEDEPCKHMRPAVPEPRPAEEPEHFPRIQDTPEWAAGVAAADSERALAQRFLESFRDYTQDEVTEDMIDQLAVFLSSALDKEREETVTRVCHKCRELNEEFDGLSLPCKECKLPAAILGKEEP